MAINTRGTDGGISAEFRELEKCLLCSSRNNNVDGGMQTLGPYRGTGAEAGPEREREEGHSSALDTNLWTTLILRKLLDLSMEDCQEVFEIGGAQGYPEIKVCGDCAQFIQQFRKGHDLLLEIGREVELMKEAARGRLLDNSLANEECVRSGSVRERVLVYFPDAAGVQTASNQSPSAAEAAGSAYAGLSLESELGSEADAPAGEESGNDTQAEAESEPSPSSSSAKSTEEKEKVRKAEMADKKAKPGKGPKSTQREDSGAARRRTSFQRRDRQNQSHRVREQNKSRHACLFCGKGFSFYSELIRHTRAHTQEKPYFCQACSKEFSQLSALRDHIRTHTNERPYKCELCSKRFSRSTTLTTHMRVHTKEKPYNCPRCNKWFSYSGGLKYHLGWKNKACKE